MVDKFGTDIVARGRIAYDQNLFVLVWLWGAVVFRVHDTMRKERSIFAQAVNFGNLSWPLARGTL